jgi:proteasome alpha subunit
LGKTTLTVSTCLLAPATAIVARCIHNRATVFTPYDWQEGIGNRAQYIEGKLAQGVPVLAVSLAEGMLLFTYRRQAKKIYEIYDRLIFAGVGQQSDVESLRMAAVDFAHQEGYNRSEQDVTIQRVATALSGPLKKAFADFGSAPLVARSLFGEVSAAAEDDVYYVLDYDGDYAISRGSAVLAGSETQEAAFRGKLDSVAGMKPEKAVDSIREIWHTAMESEEQPLSELLDGLTAESVLLERSDLRENRFRVLAGSD